MLPSPPFLTPRILRAAIRLLRQSPALPRKYLRKRALRIAYHEGRGRSARRGAGEPPDDSILEAGTELARQVLDSNLNKHRQSNYRVLVIQPPSITAEFWFGGLRSSMEHTGIACRILPYDANTADIRANIDEFRPNIFIATELPSILRTLDLHYLRAYKRQSGCLRLFVPLLHAGAPVASSTAREDEWRWGLRRHGLTADAYFSIFEQDFYERFVRDPDGPEIDFVTVPQACNLFTDRPLPESKTYDYFMAASPTDERLEVTYRFARSIMSDYHGLWAGPRWGFGRTHVPPEEMPTYYSRTRVALSTLAGFVSSHAAELTHRVFAAAGCGTFQLATATPLAGRYFEPDELVQARSPEEYRRMFDHFVDRPDERNAVALRALHRVYRDHTCFNRIDRLVECWDAWRRRGLF